MAEAPRRERLVLGRNFVETLILTHEQMLLSVNPDPRQFVAGIYESVSRIEEVVCALALGRPAIADSYVRAVKLVISQAYPDLPEPELRGCFILDQVRDYMTRYAPRILGPGIHIDVEQQIMYRAVRVVRSAQLHVLAELGSLSVS